MEFRKYSPYLAALVIFLGLTLISFWPAFSGDVLEQSDIKQFKSMSHETAEFRKTYGTEPLWTSSMFCGMPTTQVSQIYPGNWLTKIDEAFHLFLPRPSGYVFLAFVGFFVLLLSLKTDPWLSILGSVAFGLSTYFFLAIRAGHNSKVNAIDYMPFIIAGIVLVMTNRRWLGFAVLTLFMALEFNANHLQITYYTFLLSGILLINYFIVEWRKKNLRNFFIGLGLFGAATGIAVLPNAGNLMMTYEYAKHSTRNQTELTIRPGDLQSNAYNQTGGVTKDYAFEWSNGTDEALTFFIPNYKGGASVALKETEHANLKAVNPGTEKVISQLNAYFGGLPRTDGAVYIGVIIMFLAIGGVFISRHPLRWGLLAATIIAVLFAMGKNFASLNEFVLEHLPGYNKFRTVPMIMVIAQLTLPLLAVFALDKLIKSRREEETIENAQPQSFRALKITGWIILGFCVLTLSLPSLLNNFETANESAIYKQKFISEGTDPVIAETNTALLLENLTMVRANLVQLDAFRSALFLAAGFLLIILFLRKKINTQTLLLILGLLITIDLLLIDNRYINASKYEERSEAEAAPELTRIDSRILSDTSYYRIANGTVDNLFIDATTSYYHHSIGGYSAAKLGRYDELVKFAIIPELRDFAYGIDSVKRVDSLLNKFMEKFPVMNMLNTKYFILRGQNGGRGVVTNLNANGNAWFIQNVKTVVSADSEIVSLSAINPGKTMVLRESNKSGLNIAPVYKGEGSIRLLHHLPNEMVYESNTASTEFAVFSEIYYPDGWTATIDGKETKHICVNYLLRGMEIPAGKHRIVFRYLPQTYVTGNKIAMAGSILVILVTGFAVFVALRKKKKAQA